MLLISLHRRVNRFRKSEFAKNTAILTFGTIVAQVVAIASMPVITRLYTPADFGILALFIAVSSIVGTASTLRYETAIILPKDEHESKTLLLLSCLLAVLFGIMIGITTWLLPDAFKTALGISTLNQWLVLAVLCGTTTALINTASNWYNRKRAYIKIATLRVTQSSAVALIGVALGLLGYHEGLMLAQLVGSLIAVFVALFGLRAMQLKWHSHELQVIAKKQRAAPKYILPTTLLDVITQQLPVFLITVWFSSEAAGQFTMAWKILALPASLIGTAVGQVFLQRFAETWPDAKSARKLLFRTWKMLALLGFVPAVLILIFGEQLFSWILGDAWSGAGKIAMVLAPMLFAILISSPTSGIYLVLKLQKLSLYFGICFLLYRTGCLYLGFAHGNMLYGFAAWVACELIAITTYNAIALKKMKTP